MFQKVLNIYHFAQWYASHEGLSRASNIGAPALASGYPPGDWENYKYYHPFLREPLNHLYDAPLMDMTILILFPKESKIWTSDASSNSLPY